LHRGELAVGPAVILMSSTPRVYNQDHRKLRRQKRYRKNQYQNTGNKEGPNGLTHTTPIFKGPDMLGQKFIHFEHVGRVYAKQVAQFLIANNFALILRILQSILPNVCPQLLHNLDHP
jgi:hypothetical protein